MIRRLLVFWLCLLHNAGFVLAQDDAELILIGQEVRYQMGLDGSWQKIDLPTLLLATPALPSHLPFKPLFPPIYSGLADIWILTGVSDPYNDFYRYKGASWERLTNASLLFPEAELPLLSVSVEAFGPHPDGFLYRARVLDALGTDYNALYFYSWEIGDSEVIPFFGKNPVWSPDGTELVGARYHESRYELWRVDLQSGEEAFLDYGCNPQWFGDWLAYDEHDNAHWQNYTDCFANGEVAALNMLTGQKIALTAELEPFLQLASWVSD